MPKRSKKEKLTPNFVVFLVEGESDKIALENPLSELIFEKYPDYEVRFLLQQKLVNRSGDEVDDGDVDDDEGVDDKYLQEDEYILGGDITTSSFVTPDNIITKIENRFIKPATKAEGLYARRIAKVIHIMDMDGAYISDERIVPFSSKRGASEKPYYDEERGVIETRDVEALKDRNARKQKNVDYLLSLSENGIKIGPRIIPYEVYFFSSNLDHFINHDANLESGKKYYARRFLEEYGLYIEKFCSFFFGDPSSIGKLGYKESWDRIRGDDSVKRFTNIDYLIRYLLETE